MITLCLHFGEIVYISEVNGARKVASDAQVTMNKNSDPLQNFSLRVAGEDGAPNSNLSKLLELTETSHGLQVIIDEANSRRYDVTQ